MSNITPLKTIIFVLHDKFILLFSHKIVGHMGFASYLKPKIYIDGIK